MMPKYKCWAPEFHDEDDAIEVDAFEADYAAEFFTKLKECFDGPEEAEAGLDVCVMNMETNKVTKFRVIGWLQMQYLASEVE